MVTLLLFGAASVLEQKFNDCFKKSMEGLTVHVDLSSQDFPNACCGVLMSTQFTLVYEERFWRFVGAERSRCGEFKGYDVILTDLMREELLKAFGSFSC